MSCAVCISCGTLKKKAFDKCHVCNFDPNGDEVSMAKSILLSTRYYYEVQECRFTKSDLEEIGNRIASGQEYQFDPGLLEQLVDQKRLLEQGLPLRDGLKIAGFVSAFLLIPIIAVMVYLYR